MRIPERYRPSLLCGALLALYVALAVPALVRDASVADEHPHILSGWLFWTCGRFSGGLDNPPLGQLLVASPLRLLRAAYHFPADTHLLLARLPVLALALGLAALVWRWAMRVGGTPLAAVALLFFCLEPNMLAHGHLATLDLPVTFFWWAALWQWRGVLVQLASPPAPAASRPAAAFPWAAGASFTAAAGLALFTKFTGAILLPAAVLVGLLVLRARRRWLLCLALVGGSLCCLGLASHLVYAFEPVRFGLPEHLVQAVAGKIAHRDAGHFAYLMGRRSTSGFLDYYLVALVLKTPLPLLLLAGLGLGSRKLQPVDRWLFVVPAVLVVLVFSLLRVNIGVRHVLPVYPALVLLAAHGALVWWGRRGWQRGVVAALVGLWAVGFARSVPQYVSYFNIAAGGGAGGHRYLLDSNLAWGQDDARLQRFLARAAQRGEVWELNPPGETARTGRLVVDVNTLHQLLRADASPYDWLRPLPASGSAGNSWRLYALSLEDFAVRAERRPTDSEAQIAFAEALHTGGEVARAQEVYERAAASPALVAVARSAATLALARADYAAAESWIRRGLVSQPMDHALNAALQRVRLERRFASDARGGSGRDALELGLWWAERGDVAAALPWLRRAATARPHDPEAVRALAVGLAQRGEFAAAARLLEQSPLKAAFEADRTALRRLAQVDSIVGRADGKATGDEAAFAASAWMELGSALFRIRHYDRAAAVLLDLLRHDPSDGAALALLCELQVRAKLRIVAEMLTPRPAPGVHTAAGRNAP